MLFSASFLALLLPSVLAHPGHNVAEEAAERAAYLKLKPRTIGSCKDSLSARSRESANIARRHDLLKNLRAQLLVKRDFAEYNYSHEYTGGDINTDTDPTTIFADNSSCVLQPDVTQGPYYVNGELIRKDVREDQDGVPLYLDLQIIDTSTCDPVSDLYFDIWHANATGVYSGIVANGNGNNADSSNIDTTFLRGIQQTDSNGIVQFITIVPGHYTGRAPHIHILSHAPADTTVLSNDTLATDGDTVVSSHVGQLFFDQDLLTQVFELDPYTGNTQDLTLNSDDQILAQEAASVDPFVEYTLIGDTLDDGLLAWISIGIDSSETSDITSAATYYESGGVENSDSSTGGPGGGNGTGSAPSGAPSAVASSAVASSSPASSGASAAASSSFASSFASSFSSGGSASSIPHSIPSGTGASSAPSSAPPSAPSVTGASIPPEVGASSSPSGAGASPVPSGAGGPPTSSAGGPPGESDGWGEWSGAGGWRKWAGRSPPGWAARRSNSPTGPAPDQAPSGGEGPAL
ncbi:hypothetical protein DV736_g6213, partial [Chaetothyriales sp. CBS 134916]